MQDEHRLSDTISVNSKLLFKQKPTKANNLQNELFLNLERRRPLLISFLRFRYPGLHLRYYQRVMKNPLKT